jgi:lipopolysaccharide assembly protein A
MSADQSSRGNPVARFALNYWAPIALVAISAIFIGQNRDRQQVHFLWATVESPMWLLLAAMLVVGVAVGLLLRRRRR